MGPNNDLAKVSAIVRQKMAAGILPTETPTKVWAGKGTGKPCDACELRVTSADMEFETDLPGGRTLRFHQACLAVWHQERARSQNP